MMSDWFTGCANVGSDWFCEVMFCFITFFLSCEPEMFLYRYQSADTESERDRERYTERDSLGKLNVTLLYMDT